MMQPNSYQWWYLDGPVELNGQGEMLYSMLGPMMTRQVLSLLDQAVESGFELTPELERLYRELRAADGQAPRLLQQLALALAALLAPSQPGLFRGVGPTLIEAANRQRFEILKSAGWFVSQRLRSFGFDEITFALNAAEDGPWPPRGVELEQVAPPSPQMAPQSTEHAEQYGIAADTSGLTTPERCLLLDHYPLPECADGFDTSMRRVLALIQAAVDGRKWAQPYVSGWESRLITFTYDLWAEALGVDVDDARVRALAIEAALFGRLNGMNWHFNT